MEKLPIDSFRWLSKEEMLHFNVFNNSTGEKGYFIECDLRYPEHLHGQHSNLPLAPELLEIHFDNLSPYSQNAIEKTEGVKRYKDTKLMSTFHDRINYVVHIRNLQLYLSLGMELIRIHRILEFRQGFLLRPYITKTTEARKCSESKFDMDLFKKLVINRIFYLNNKY